jgi:hypothetical protein
MAAVRKEILIDVPSCKRGTPSATGLRFTNASSPVSPSAPRWRGATGW